MPIRCLSSHPVTYVSVHDLSTYWMVSRRQIYKHISSGALPAIRVSPRCYRISTKAAAEFERRMTLQPEKPPLNTDSPSKNESERQRRSSTVLPHVRLRRE